MPVKSSTDSAEIVKATLSATTARICLTHFGDALRAIVLGGAFARDEANFVRQGEDWKLVGDADFFVVFRYRIRPHESALVPAVAKEIQRTLRAEHVIADISIAAVDCHYLESRPNHISPFELRVCGRVVWGDSDVLSMIPSFKLESLSLEDAWRILGNRMVELLEVIGPGAQQLSPEAEYRTVKLCLDMATSYLLFAGRYFPTYRDRERALRELAEERHARAPFDLPPFADIVTAATRFKVEGRPLDRSVAEFHRDVLEFARALWRWELAELSGGPAQLSATDLMSCWMKRQPFGARIRGWASLLKRSAWLRSWREWPRWLRLAWTASPRYWVYSVAAQLLFDSSLSPQQALELSRRLPLPSQTFEGELHQWLAFLVSLHYRKFLATTTA